VDQLNEEYKFLPALYAMKWKFFEEDLIAKVIMKNMPSIWVKDFKIAKLHLQTEIKNVMADLVVIKEQIKIKPKQLKTPCCAHNGHHKWTECLQNPKKNKSDEKNNKGNNHHQGRGNENNGKSCEEHPGNKTKIKAIAGPEIAMTWIADKNIIVLGVVTTIIKVQMKRCPD
jgi:hypothetical protein